MVESSFYGDTPNYATDYPTQNDSNTNAAPNTPAPSSFYPDGGVYDTLVNSDTLQAQLEADLAAAQAAQAAAELAAANADADAAAAHQAYLDAVALLATSLLKANNLSDLTNVAQAKINLSLVKGDVGLGNVDNTSDANKPVSTAQAAADALVASNAAAATALKANIASPALTGVPTAPTAAPGTNTTQLATTAFVEAARVILAAADALKAPLASPALTGVPTAPTATAGTNTTQIATTAFVEAARVILAAATALKADIASPAFTGTPTAPTATVGTNTTQIATTAFVLANAGGGGASVTVADTAPASPTANSLWWESDTGNLYIYYNDGTSSQWVMVVGGVMDGAVRFDTSTTLTKAQKAQARSNISAGAFAANRNAVDQTGLVSSTETKVVFNNEVFDTDGCFDTTLGRYTPPAGNVLLSAQVWITGTFATGNSTIIKIYKNGVAFRGAFTNNPIANTAVATVTITDIANGTDYYEVWASQFTSSGTATVKGDLLWTYFHGNVL